MKTAYYLLAASTLLLTFSCISSTGPDDPETVPPTVPVVTTADFTDLTTSSVKVGGEVKEDGGAEVTARGIVYGDQANPTVEASSITDEGKGTGVFESELSELKSSTTYIVLMLRMRPVRHMVRKKPSRQIWPRLSQSLSMIMYRWRWYL